MQDKFYKNQSHLHVYRVVVAENEVSNDGGSDERLPLTSVFSLVSANVLLEKLLKVLPLVPSILIMTSLRSRKQNENLARFIACVFVSRSMVSIFWSSLNMKDQGLIF
ncbi:hypothetical protein Y032_0088g2155 [Ancylostoma ceylanicum]|uniref:Uncharacterized protein n=1 Tax=Ancylostoma ceylanicum TaxID=53326 RepID=A0A016TPE6_9BILA|nr:hypothetical protein Y032_0088g2155 [Ancylostoma ceylanicum]